MISIILPTYNEKENIKSVIDELFKAIPDNLEIIVVDDDSPDGTYQTVMDLKIDNVKCIRRKNTRGLAAAFNRGIIESRGDIVGWMDADMSMPPSLLRQMHEKIVQEDFDIVIGSRYVEGGSDDRGRLRVVTSQGINRLAGMILGYGIKDYDSGFVILKRNVFDSVSLMPYGFGEYFMEFIYHACRKGFKVTEIGYRFKDRTYGESKSTSGILRSLSTGLNYIFRIIKARISRVE